MNKITEILYKVAGGSKPWASEEGAKRKKPEGWYPGKDTGESKKGKAMQSLKDLAERNKPKDTTGGLLDKKDYGDVNADGKLDVRDAVAGHANQKGMKEKFGINVNPKGQLKEGSISKAANVFNKISAINPDAALAAASSQGLQGAAAMALADDKMKTPASGLSGNVIGGNLGNDRPQVGAAQNEMAHDLTDAGQKLSKSRAAYLATRLGIPVGADTRAMKALEGAPDRIITPLGPDNSKEPIQQ